MQMQAASSSLAGLVMSLPESQAKKSGGELLSVNELFDTSPTKAFFTELCAVCVVEWVSLRVGR